MTPHIIATREEWLDARTALLADEKEHTRRGDELARKRQALPWVRIDKDYLFHSEDGNVSLRDLFGGLTQLLVHHFMFTPSMQGQGCPSCSSVADGYDGFRVHLEHHDVALVAVSRAPLTDIVAYKRRMGWSFPWVSSEGSDFNVDFAVSFTEDQLARGAELNYRTLTIAPDQLPHGGTSTQLVDAAESPGLSALALEDGVVYHTYSTYARGTDALWGMWQWLDRAPFGRNESAMQFKRHDEYEH
jgi:predicted dithiol-disulfide oxidoreductase (DUF899 family)